MLLETRHSSLRFTALFSLISGVGYPDNWLLEDHESKTVTLGRQDYVGVAELLCREGPASSSPIASRNVMPSANDQAGANVMARDTYGHTPLHVCVMWMANMSRLV